MQRAFLVSNKATQAREYLEQRSILKVETEYRSLSDINVEQMQIVDVEKFIYLYYNSDDGDLAFRKDLNTMRQMLSSAFFNVDEAIFILVDCQDPMLEDLIKSACRNSNIIGDKLTVIHHSGVLMLNELALYVSGISVGVESTSSYRAVYIKEADTEERERYESYVSDGLVSIIPVLTDQYSMYKTRSGIEAISSGRIVTEEAHRPQVTKSFAKRSIPTIRQWKSFIISGEEYTQYHKAVSYLTDYFMRVGLRSLVIDITTDQSIQDALSNIEVKKIPLTNLTTKSFFTESVAYVKLRFGQLGYLVEVLDNVGGVDVYIFVCDKENYTTMQELLHPLCKPLYSNYVTHFTEACINKYLSSGIVSTALFLSEAIAYEVFDIKKYKQDFLGTRVARLELSNADTTSYYEFSIGGGVV